MASVDRRRAITIIVAILRKGWSIVSVTFYLMLFASPAWRPPAQGASTVILLLDPPQIEAANGDILTLAIRVEGVEDLHRVELRLSYDEAGLEVQDADPGRAGVQIEPGPLFEGNCAIQNEADQGTISFIAQRAPGTASFSGEGLIASISVKVVTSQPAPYTISFDQAASSLLNDEGRPITVEQFTDAVLILPPSMIELIGLVTREGWDAHSRSGVSAVLYPAVPKADPLAEGHACTDISGNVALEIQTSSQPLTIDMLPDYDPPASVSCNSWWVFVQLDFTHYLSECYWECADDLILDIGRRELEGGDVNKDSTINILDIVHIIGSFGETVLGSDCCVPFTECPCPSPAAETSLSCDINGDCRVDILDLTQTAGNFGLYSNCPDIQLPTAYD